jgi:hypothetical protein
MKSHVLKTISMAITPLVLLVLFSFQCSDTHLPKDYMGNWHTNATKVTVRTKIKWMKYQFTSENIPLSLSLTNTETASGKIGMASFENAKITANKGNSSVTGISYIIHCGKLNKLFESDNSGEKTLEIWLKPKKNSQTLEAELRLRDGWDTFPMADCSFSQ